MISQSCNQCATTKCIQTSSGGSSHNKSSGGGGGGNAGAIAGGVIGGVAFVAIVTGLFWWFFIRKKRNEYSLGGAGAGQEKRGGTSQQTRKSTNSIASTVLTRASNVIQIAYIPGVTNRSPPDTPSSLVPPVPPLPGAAPDQHFFMPGDLRDSSFTDLSNDRRSGAPTISPSLRSSVATTTYRNNAIVSPIPAQQATLTRAAVVSIHGNQPANQTAVITPPDAPAVPAITSAQLAKAGVNDANNKSNDSNNNSSIVARTMMAKPVMVKTQGSKKKNNNNNDATPAIQTIEERSENSAPVSLATSPNEQGDVMASGFDDSSDDEPESPGARSTKSVKRSDTVKTTASKAPTVIEDTPATEQSPFTDQQASTSESPTTQPTSDAQTAGSNRSSRAPPPPRVQSPFSDANELK